MCSAGDRETLSPIAGPSHLQKDRVILTEFAVCRVLSGAREQSADVVIVGGGAAGFFAAIHCAEANPDLSVTVLEKGPRVLTKVLVSGGGRCNVTHACFEPRELVRRYPRGERELLGPFHGWQPRDTVEWFAARGVELKTESDGRMFPTTDRAATIADCLQCTAQKAGVRVLTKRGVTTVARTGEGGFRIGCDKEVFRTKRLMIATGGMKPGPVMNFLSAFGHSIEPLAPSLFTFHVDDPRLAGLPGLSVEWAEVSVPGARLRESGPVLITHWGLSGPAVLKLSAWGARMLAERDYQFVCQVNWSGQSQSLVADEFRSLKHSDGRKQVKGMPRFGVPRRIWERLVYASGLSDSITWSQVSGKALDRLVAELTAGEFTVSGKSMNKEEFVTCGGVRLKEVNFKTMESKIVPGLYFGGEVLDIDAITGGFNFQSAWTTGRAAGRAIANP